MQHTLSSMLPFYQSHLCEVLQFLAIVLQVEELGWYSLYPGLLSNRSTKVASWNRLQMTIKIKLKSSLRMLLSYRIGSQSFCSSGCSTEMMLLLSTCIILSPLVQNFMRFLRLCSKLKGKTTHTNMIMAKFSKKARFALSVTVIFGMFVDLLKKQGVTLPQQSIRFLLYELFSRLRGERGFSVFSSAQSTLFWSIYI